MSTACRRAKPGGRDLRGMTGRLVSRPVPHHERCSRASPARRYIDCAPWRGLDASYEDATGLPLVIPHGPRPSPPRIRRTQRSRTHSVMRGRFEPQAQPGLAEIPRKVS